MSSKVAVPADMYLTTENDLPKEFKERVVLCLWNDVIDILCKTNPAMLMIGTGLWLANSKAGTEKRDEAATIVRAQHEKNCFSL